MPVALLLLAVAADPTPADRDRLKALLAAPQATGYWQVMLTSGGAIDYAAARLHRDELAVIDQWLTVWPGDEVRLRRAVFLAEHLHDEPAKRRYAAALGRVLLARVTRQPAAVSARVAYAEWLGDQTDRTREAEAAAWQAVRLAPTSADAWRCLGLQCDPTDADAEAEAALARAEALSPADWRLPAARAQRELWRAGQRARAGDRDALAAGSVAAEPHRRRAAQLAGADPAALRWAAASSASRLAGLTAPGPAARALAGEMAVDMARLADADPTDARVVCLAVLFELVSRAPADAERLALAFEALPADRRRRAERWLDRVAAAVAADADPEAAEKATTAAVLFSLIGRHDPAVAAAERAVALRPTCGYCELVRQNVLLRIGRTAEAVACSRFSTAGRTPAELATFEVECLQNMGGWAEAVEKAEAAQAQHPDDRRIKLVLAVGLLYADTPASRLAAEIHIHAVLRSPADGPDDELIRKQANRLLVIADLLGGRSHTARQLLGAWRQAGQPLPDDAVLTAIAGPPPTIRVVGVTEPAGR